MNEIEIPNSIQQALNSYKPSLTSSLRYRLDLLIRGVYDHLRDADAPEVKRFGNEILEPLAKLCAVVDAMLETKHSRSVEYVSEARQAFAKGDYLRAIEEHCPHAVSDYRYRGEYYHDRHEQQTSLAVAIARDPYILAHVTAAKRFKDLPARVQEHILDWGIDPDAIFMAEPLVAERSEDDV